MRWIWHRLGCVVGRHVDHPIGRMWFCGWLMEGRVCSYCERMYFHPVKRASKTQIKHAS